MNFPGDSGFVIRLISLTRSLSGKSLADIGLDPIDPGMVKLSQNLHSLPRKAGIMALQLIAGQFMGLETYRCRGLAGSFFLDNMQRFQYCSSFRQVLG